MNSAILFFDVGPGAGLPLARRVAARGLLPIVNSAGLAEALQGEGVPHRLLGSFARPGIPEVVRREIERIADGLATALARPEGVRAFDSPCGSFLPHTGSELFARCLELLGNEILHIELLEALVHDLDLRLLVLGCDNNHAERAVLGCARRHSVPSLQLAHGIYSPPIFGRVAGEMTTLYSDTLAAYGSRARDLMIEMGAPAERILCTGAPAWDPLFSGEARIDPARARRALGLDPDRPVVALFSEYDDGASAGYLHGLRSRLPIFHALAAAVQRLDPLPQLVLRPHPQESLRHPVAATERADTEQTFRSWWESISGVPMRILRSPRVETIRAADVVLVSSESTVTVEVMILERPVVVIPHHDRRLILSPQDGVRFAGPPELASVLAELLADPGARDAQVARQRHALRALHHGNDGRAAERVAELILNLADRTPRRWTAAPSRESGLAASGETPCPSAVLPQDLPMRFR